MLLYPAIDMMNGKAVRLRQGKRDDVTVYGDPVEVALRWKALGAQWLHLVDLDAAFDGASTSLPLIARVVEAFGGKVELGGGIRTLEDAQKRIDAGVTRVIIGTAAAENPDMVAQACARWPGHIAVGIDAKNGIVATRGWVESAGMTATELALQMKQCGVKDIIYTDVSRDGMMQGPNVQATAALVEATGMDIIGSGGVSRLSDLMALKQAGCAGAILGKALYEGAFTLPEAIALIGEE
jgi:phosphoribosylformimino-5-aminoimidazole carboxamide ribotide isomerase